MFQHLDDDAGGGVTELLLESIFETRWTVEFFSIARPPRPALATSKHGCVNGHTGVFDFAGERVFAATRMTNGSMTLCEMCFRGRGSGSCLATGRGNETSPFHGAKRIPDE